VKAIILAEKRTGSTFLQEVLRSHPDIISLDELFMGRPGYGDDNSKHGTKLFKTFFSERLGSTYSHSTVASLAEEYIKMIINQSNNVIFRLMYSQCENWMDIYKLNIPNIIKKFKMFAIHIYRKNYLRTVLSHHLKQQYKDNIIKKSEFNLDITPEQLYKNVRKNIERHEKYKKRFRSVNTYDVAFEDLLGKTIGNRENIKFHGQFNIKSDQITYINEEEGRKLCKWMDVRYIPMHTDISRISDNNIWSHLKYEDEIKELFKKKDLGYMCEL